MNQASHIIYSRKEVMREKGVDWNKTDRLRCDFFVDYKARMDHCSRLSALHVICRGRYLCCVCLRERPRHGFWREKTSCD